METLFRLLLARPAIAQDDENPSILLAQNTNFQAALAASVQDPDPRAILKNASRQFIATAGYAKTIAQVPLNAELKLVGEAFNDLEAQGTATPAKVAKAIKDAFGGTVAATVGKQPFKDAETMLKDTILAIKQLPAEHARPIERFTKALRDLEVVKKAAVDAEFPADEKAFRKYRRRSVQLPTQADLRSILDGRDKTRKEEEDRRKKEEDRRKQVTDKAGLYAGLKKAITELMELDKNQLETTLQKSDGGAMPTSDLRPLNVFAAEIARKGALGQLAVLAARSEGGKLSNDKRSAVALAGAANVVGEAGTVARKFFAGKGAFQPTMARLTMFRFKIGTDLLLSQETRMILKQRGLDTANMALDLIVTRLREEMEEMSKVLHELTGGDVMRSFKRMGNALVITRTLKPSAWSLMGTGIIFAPLPLPLDMRVPATRGKATPVGVADLLVIKQHLMRYEGADVAHIENVLKNEAKVREHRRFQQTEEILFRESETTTTEEHELESTDRFEMSRESSTTIKEDASLKAGLSISGSYGPTVEFSASAEGSLSRSKEEATRSASTFSKDVTERSSRKLTERVLERSQRRVTNEVEEKNSHTLNNVGGSGHISGVYQWVEKVYEAQMFNYGMRMMYDFMVPEPGAFLIETLQSAHASAMEVEKPEAFPLKPDQITETNYHTWVHVYGAGGVQPPPDEFITKSFDYHAGEGGETTDFTHSGIIQIDEGYAAVHGTVYCVWNQWDNTASIDVVLGSRAHRIKDDGNWGWSTSLDWEMQSLPFALNTNQISDIGAAIEVKCQRTARAMKKWQLETHAKLMEAYQAKLSDYEERMAAARVQAGVAIQGKNPALNLEMMKDELKKNCISIITAQHYDLFHAIQNGSNGLPQLDLYENEAEGPYVRFFEQAFEWEHITWVTYPYFWGRKNQWDERVAMEDTDPLFNQFIKAGYCRTVVPVRPGFEGAVDHFLTFGEIWNGGPLPAISNPLYLPIADELAERLDRPGTEIPQGDPWEVRVPTTLIHLRADDQLPTWQKNAQGDWVEV